ncbi:transmembrane protein 87B-like [Gossypium australe]|uniref:Transmembrane protein 87B-like n=1 Tax=Gossypium australe TaxID=47621 RepID=A0A5B6WDT0_9ROSI|nr:transmembrane protein 87B-like [Gossypium australe]
MGKEDGNWQALFVGMTFLQDVFQMKQKIKLYFNATDPLSEFWQIAWIIPAFWNMIAYCLLVVICVLWAPSRNPTRYAYMEGMGEDSDEEGIALTGNSGDMAMKLERQAIGDDLEEDKRE